MTKFHEFISTAFHIIAIIISITALIPALIIGTWALDTKHPVEHMVGVFDKWDGYAPHTAVITWSGLRHRVCPGTAYRWIIGQRSWYIQPDDLPPPSAHDFHREGVDTWSVTVPIPPEALDTSMEYVRLRVRLVWNCNPLQNFWPLVSDPPEVLIPVPKKPDQSG